MLVRVDRAHTRLGKFALEVLRKEPGVDVTTDGSASGVDVVVDAGLAPVGRAVVERELAAGRHFVDACWQRAWAKELLELDAFAKERGRAAICAAGTFSGLTDPFARQGAEQMVRVNEVLLGLAVGDARELDDESMALLLAGRERTIEMLIGGERTVRRFHGDRRAFGFPPPIGDQFGANVDVPELETFTGRGVKSASVRLTVSPQSKRASQLTRLFLSLSHRGWIKSPENAPATWKARLAAVAGGGKPWCAAVILRGIGSNRLPLELRHAFIPPAGRPEALSAAALVETVLVLQGSPVAGAGPCAGRVNATKMSARLKALGVQRFGGDFGGWKPLA
jgi:hypothetical protein